MKIKEETVFRSCPFCGKPCVKRSHQEWFYDIRGSAFAAAPDKEWFEKMCKSKD